MDPITIGLAAAAAGAAAISAFRDGRDLFRSWREKRKAKSLAKEKEVEHSLERNPPEVEKEYTQSVAHLGHRFVRGDDISNRELKRIIKEFSRTLIATIKSSRDSNLVCLFDVSENARHDSLNVMLQLCQRLHTSAPIKRMPKGDEQTPADKQPPETLDEPRVSIYTFTGANLQNTLDQIPKASPNITLSGTSLVFISPPCTPRLLNGSSFINNESRDGLLSHTGLSLQGDIQGYHETQYTISPLRQRLDEMNRNFQFCMRSSVAAEPSSLSLLSTPNPTKHKPPSVHSYMSQKTPVKPSYLQTLAPHHSTVRPLECQSEPEHAWTTNRSTISSRSADTSMRSGTPTLMSDQINAQTKGSSLQEKLHVLTHAIASTGSQQGFTPLISPTISAHSKQPTVSLPLRSNPPRAVTLRSHSAQAPKSNETDHRTRISQWIQDNQTASSVSEPGSDAGSTYSGTEVFPGVPRYGGSVRMSGGLG